MQKVQLNTLRLPGVGEFVAVVGLSVGLSVGLRVGVRVGLRVGEITASAVGWGLCGRVGDGPLIVGV